MCRMTDWLAGRLEWLTNWVSEWEDLQEIEKYIYTYIDKLSSITQETVIVAEKLFTLCHHCCCYGYIQSVDINRGRGWIVHQLTLYL